jgi:hypothetical protein
MLSDPISRFVTHTPSVKEDMLRPSYLFIQLKKMIIQTAQWSWQWATTQIPMAISGQWDC